MTNKFVGKNKNTTKITALVVLCLIVLFNIISALIWGEISHFTLVFILVIFLLVLHKKSAALSLLLIALILVEITLSFVSPYRSYMERNGKWSYIFPYTEHERPKPYEAGFTLKNNMSEFKYTHLYNNLGYRDSNKKLNNFKAIIIGDSFIEGLGLDSAETIDKNLERLLSCPNCILNAGLSGNEVANGFKLIKDLVLIKGIKTEMVLLNINETDIADIYYSGVTYPQLQFNAPSTHFQMCYGSSFIFRHIMHRYVSFDLLTDKQRELAELKSLNFIKQNIIQINTFCKEQNIQFFVFFQPDSYNCTDKDFAYSKLINELPHDINAINLLHVFDDDCNKYFWPIDGHFNKEGSLQYSKAIYNKVFLNKE